MKRKFNLFPKTQREEERIKMAKTTITVPAQVRLVNNSDATVRFAPYKENFTTALGAGESLVLVAKTLGQVLYYKKQATNSISVTTLDTEDDGYAATIAATTYNCITPATVTITNNSTSPINFVPYRENFQYTINGGDALEFEIANAGQAIYYNNQDVYVGNSAVFDAVVTPIVSANEETQTQQGAGGGEQIGG